MMAHPRIVFGLLAFAAVVVALLWIYPVSTVTYILGGVFFFIMIGLAYAEAVDPNRVEGGE